jgi:UDP-N-acetylmuramoylalanine--D-glutamate ligase
MQKKQLEQKKIGIWGYGVTGKSAAHYFHQLGLQVEVIEKKNLTEQEQSDLLAKKIHYFAQSELNDFLSRNDAILASPGIDLRPFTSYKDKWLTELDIFYANFNKPIIAITGSIGKTTITHLLSILLNHAQKKVLTGGNIGTPMLDLLKDKEKSDLALLEISSFQLEYCKDFAPLLAIITNIYPNHLDRHDSEKEYLEIKAKMIAYQQEKQQALIPWNLKNKIKAKSMLHFFSKTKPSNKELQSLENSSKLFFIHSGEITVYHKGNFHSLLKLKDLPSCTFEDNWLILCASLNLLNIPIPDLTKSIDFKLPEHRMEKVATINEIDFYNDSKSTTIQSTLAAIDRLKDKPILLLLGGLSKGVDRSQLIKDLHPNVKKIYCFGKEAESLKKMCDQYERESEAIETLDAAIAAIFNQAQSGDQVLLSPAGSSYDLFTNYIERGNHFKKLVNEFYTNKNDF